MKRIWEESRGNARLALILGILAEMSFLFPVVLAFVLPMPDRGGVFFLLFWPLALALAILATAKSIAASRLCEWWREDGGKCFLCVLYGLPVFLLVLMGGWLMKR